MQVLNAAENQKEAENPPHYLGKAQVLKDQIVQLEQQWQYPDKKQVVD